MSASPWYRLQRFGRDRSQLVRGPARRLRRALSVLLYHLRRVAGQDQAPRVVVGERPAPAVPVAHPAILVSATDPETRERFLTGQTESSVTVGPEAHDATFWLAADGDLSDFPPTHLEALLLAAAADGLAWARGGWAAPAEGRFGPQAELYRAPGVSEAALTLLRLPRPGHDRGSQILGRSVPHVTAVERLSGKVALGLPGATPSGPYHLLEGVASTPVHHRARRVDQALAALPETAGPRTILFTLPFLAVGGAERLLFDLLEGLDGRCRSLVVTLEPHLAALGQSVDLARALCPHVYTLGDWLPREALHSAICHLVRRYRVESLVSWNGTTWFFDSVAELHRSFPRLRLASQLYNHCGGWIEHCSSALLECVDLHLAVNHRIARALVERGVAPERVATIHHGVRVPAEASETERTARRRARRQELGLPQDTVVAGTFVRLHPQKRPLDVLEVARRLAGKGVHFLLVGGGPLDATIDAELASQPLSNLTRLPMVADTTDLYDALDLCLLTSDYEGLPVFLLDGLARAIPCVATAVGEVPELLDQGGGILVDRAGDIGALVAGVEALLDPATRLREGARGLTTVRDRFGHDRYVESYAAALLP